MQNVQIQGIVDTFVQQLSEAWRKSTLDMLSNSFGGAGSKNGHSNGNGNGKHAAKTVANGRSKGEKRTADDLAALKDKFAAFVKATPGLRIEQINKELGTNTKDLALPIRQLIADGRVKSKGSKRLTVYNPGK